MLAVNAHKTINGWTKARMIEQIYKRNNGTKSVDSKGCLYRTLDGNACAVGCFIPDEVYKIEAERMGGVDNIFDLVSRHMPLDVHGMRELQFQHDNFQFTAPGVREHLAVWIEENVEDAT